MFSSAKADYLETRLLQNGMSFRKTELRTYMEEDIMMAGSGFSNFIKAFSKLSQESNKLRIRNCLWAGGLEGLIQRFEYTYELRLGKPFRPYKDDRNSWYQWPSKVLQESAQDEVNYRFPKGWT